MTKHYNIRLEKSETDLKLTYRDGKFRKLEHLRGVLDSEKIKYIGLVIPPKEVDLDEFIESMKGRVSYTSLSENKIASIFSQFNSEWFEFFRKENDSLDPKFTGADGAALKQIITYLKQINNGSETAALANWKLLLSSWNSLSDFHQKQTDLKYINSKLNVIIREIIRNNGSNATGSDSSVTL